MFAVWSVNFHLAFKVLVYGEGRWPSEIDFGLISTLEKLRLLHRERKSKSITRNGTYEHVLEAHIQKGLFLLNQFAILAPL